MTQTKESCLVYGMAVKPTEEQLVEESLDVPGLKRRIVYLLGTT